MLVARPITGSCPTYTVSPLRPSMARMADCGCENWINTWRAALTSAAPATTLGSDDDDDVVVVVGVARTVQRLGVATHCRAIYHHEGELSWVSGQGLARDRDRLVGVPLSRLIMTILSMTP